MPVEIHAVIDDEFGSAAIARLIGWLQFANDHVLHLSIDQVKFEPQVVTLPVASAKGSDSKNLLDENIRVLGLSTRAYTCLNRCARLDYDDAAPTVGWLVGLSARDLMSLTNFGEVCLRDVISKLDAFGYKLKEY